MKHLSSPVQLFIQLAKTQSRLTNRFDRALGGLSLTEFLVLLSLEQAPDRQLSRIALAEHVGLTASGITRILLPMAKVHLVKDGKATDDARVRTVEATAAGREKLNDELVRLGYLADELLPAGKTKDLHAMTEFLKELSGRAIS